MLEGWGLAATAFEPRKSTPREMNALYRGLYAGTLVNAEERELILDWMAVYSENDDLRLGRMNELSEQKIFPYNKRGSLVSPLLNRSRQWDRHHRRKCISTSVLCLS